MNNTDKLAVIGEIAAAMAHEMRTPLTVIKNSIYFLQVAGIEGHDPKIAQHISLMNQKIDLCVRTLTNIQSFVQPTKPVKKETRLDDILTDSLTLSLANSNVKVVTQFQKNLPPVMADPFQMRQVFDNIIKNASDAMRSSGNMTITAKTDGNFVFFVFEDTGEGIPPENIEKIFIPLFSTTPHNMGLGLAVCKQFVEAHGGDINVKSEQGRGTTVTVRLPTS